MPLENFGPKPGMLADRISTYVNYDHRVVSLRCGSIYCLGFTNGVLVLWPFYGEVKWLVSIILVAPSSVVSSYNIGLEGKSAVPNLGDVGYKPQYW